MFSIILYFSILILFYYSIVFFILIYSADDIIIENKIFQIFLNVGNLLLTKGLNIEGGVKGTVEKILIKIWNFVREIHVQKFKNRTLRQYEYLIQFKINSVKQKFHRTLVQQLRLHCCQISSCRFDRSFKLIVRNFASFHRFRQRQIPPTGILWGKLGEQLFPAKPHFHSKSILFFLVSFFFQRSILSSGKCLNIYIDNRYITFIYLYIYIYLYI